MNDQVRPLLAEVLNNFNEIFSRPTPSNEELKKNDDEIAEKMAEMGIPELTNCSKEDD